MRRVLTLAASMMALAILGGVTAQGQPFAQRDPEFPQRVYTCRLNGDDVPLGERRCLTTPSGRRVAECGIALNVSTWRPLSNDCHSSE